MATLTLKDPDLVKRLQQIAAEKGISAEELLTIAVKEFLQRHMQQKSKMEAHLITTMDFKRSG